MQSDSITELAKALSDAQGEFQPAKMNAENPFLKNKYADLGSIIESVRPTLAKHGLSVSQLPTFINGNIGIETVVMHESGEWISSVLVLPLGDGEKGRSLAQSAGALLSYMRRYSLAAMLCLYADEDTDGEDKKQSKTEQHTAQSAAPLPAIEYPEHLAVVKNEKGVRYVDIDTEKLGHMANSITAASKKPGQPEDKLAEYAMKYDTIKEILALRTAQ